MFRSRSVLALLLFVSICWLSPLSAQDPEGEDLAKAFDTLKKTAENVGKEVSLDPYTRMRLQLIERFLTYRQTDLQNDREDLVAYATADLRRIIKEETLRLEAIGKGTLKPVDVPRLQTGSQPAIAGGHLESTVVWSNGKVEKQPVFLFGFGAFSGMRADIEWLGKLGINYCQSEIGPRHVATAPDEWNSATIERYNDFARRADAEGVLVDLLLSPHYIPKWLYENIPHSYVHLGGFMRFALNRPAVKTFLKETDSRILKELSGNPNIWSVCVANEPVAFNWRGDIDTEPMWREFLRQRHQTIEKANAAWQQTFKSFDDVPVFLAPPKDPSLTDPVIYDWMCFNDQRLANWLNWRTTIPTNAGIHNTHVKAIDRSFGRFSLLQGADPDLLARVGTLSGLDGGSYPKNPDLKPELAIDVLHLNTRIFRGVSSRPIINSEDHLLRDRSTNPIFTGHVRAGVWSELLTGVCGSVAWAWERRDDAPRQPFVGLFQYRPGATEEYMRTFFDAMRLSHELTAFTEQPARIALLYSRSSQLWDVNSAAVFKNTADLLLQTGAPFTIITERMLADTAALNKQHPDLQFIILPGTRYLTDAARAGLITFLAEGFHEDKGTICIGADIAAFNEYRRPRPASFLSDTGALVLPFSLTDDPGRNLRKLIKTLADFGTLPSIRPVDAATGKPVYGVCFQVAKLNESTIATAINTTAATQHIKWLDSQSKTAVLLQDKMPIGPLPEATTVCTLAPLQVVCGPLKK